jgi:hypothetical protein
MTEAKPNGSKSDLWMKIATGVVGALLLGLQGVNISETSGQTNLMHRIDTAIERQGELITEVNQEGKRIDKALENQQHMIESMETLLNNQQLALDLLKNKQFSPNQNPNKE